MLRAPELGRSVCPPLTESRACLGNSTCWTFTSLLTDWTSCRPSGQSQCGPGTQTRGRRCVRSDGRPVEPELCSDLPDPGDTRVSVACTVDCPVDCRLSPWSVWDSAQCQCGAGGEGSQLTRRRYVVVASSPTGRPCPPVLSQTKPCPPAPCYQWRLSPWSQCQLQGAACGSGLSTRNISCVLAGTDKVVADSLCLTNISGPEDLLVASLAQHGRPTSRDCYVSCDPDCTVSEWSQWSDCSQDPGHCLPQLSTGLRARSRRVVQAARQPHGVCSPLLHQTGFCLASPCFKYQWVVRDGDVFCQRSDGVRVESKRDKLGGREGGRGKRQEDFSLPD